MPSKPDFVFHVGKQKVPTWADVELLIEHTDSAKEPVTEKFLQWLRCAWSVFNHQPYRRHLYGILFLKPCGYICYADHGCAAYSERLYFAENAQHTQFLIDFLLGFIAEPEHHGKDLTVTKVNDWVCIQHAGKSWAKLSELWYHPCLIGRYIRISLVEHQSNKVVMKSTWGEKLPEEASPPHEAEILSMLLRANVRGLPQPYDLESAIVRDRSGSEMETCSFPKNCEVVLPAKTEKSMLNMQKAFTSSRTSKVLVPVATFGIAGEEILHRAKIQRRDFNKPLEVRRRLTRVMMSYCKPLREAMRGEGPKTLMQSIRDSMIVYYEAHKLPESGFIHGGKYFMNVLCVSANE